ncbi:hypothetical protein [Catellatospora bangladeshensis]
MDMTLADPQTGTGDRAPKPIMAGARRPAAHAAVYAFVLVPLLALAAAVPLAWGWGLTWTDVALTAAMYTMTCLGVTVGFHRYFTHGAFKAGRIMRITLAVAGTLAVQGPILHWVADHRRHHAFSDREETRTRRGRTARHRPRWPAASGTPTSAGCWTRS